MAYNQKENGAGWGFSHILLASCSLGLATAQDVDILTKFNNQWIICNIDGKARPGTKIHTWQLQEGNRFNGFDYRGCHTHTQRNLKNIL